MLNRPPKTLDNVLRKEAGCTTRLEYTEQTSWLLFLKYMDGLEQDKADEFILDRPYRSIKNPDFGEAIAHLTPHEILNEFAALDVDVESAKVLKTIRAQL